MKDYRDGFSTTIMLAGCIIGAGIGVESDKLYIMPLICIVFYIISLLLSNIIRWVSPEFDNTPGWIKVILALLVLYVALFKIAFIYHLFDK